MPSPLLTAQTHRHRKTFGGAHLETLNGVDEQFKKNLANAMALVKGMIEQLRKQLILLWMANFCLRIIQGAH